MELEENQYLGKNLKMKISQLNIQREDNYLWLMLVQTQMEVNSF